MEYNTGLHVREESEDCRVPFMICSPRMHISPGWFRPRDALVSGSTILSSAFLTTVPQEPDFTSNGSLAKARHMASTGPASVIPYPWWKRTENFQSSIPFLHFGIRSYHIPSSTNRTYRLVQLWCTGIRGGTRPPRVWEGGKTGRVVERNAFLARRQPKSWGWRVPPTFHHTRPAGRGRHPAPTPPSCANRGAQAPRRRRKVVGRG